MRELIIANKNSELSFISSQFLIIFIFKFFANLVSYFIRNKTLLDVNSEKLCHK